MTCRKTHFESHGAAMRALRKIQDKGEVRAYTPNGVVSCCGQHALTSGSAPGFKRGKQSRRGAATQRRR